MTYPLIGNYGRLLRRRPVGATVAAGPRRGERHGRRGREGGPARGAPPRPGDPGHRRRRHPGPGPAPADPRLDPRASSPPRARSTRRRRSRRPGRCPPGRTRTSSGLVSPEAPREVGDPAEGGPLVAHRRPRAQGEHRPLAPSTGRPGPDPAPHGHRRGGPRPGRSTASSSRPDRAIRPAWPARSRWPGPRSPTAARSSGSASATRSSGRAAGAETRRLRFGHHGANHPVRDVDSGLVQVTAQNHEVQVVAETLPAGRRLPRQPGEPQRRVGRGAAPPRAADRDGPVPPGRGARAARRPGRLRPVRGRLRRPIRAAARPWPGPMTATDRPIRRVGAPASVLILGSGPVVIGQAAEFDYAGTQACRALRAEGVRTILVNSNPATIMTDPSVADAVYLEPLTVEAIEAVIARERPEGLLAGLGGQTALNLAVALARAGVLERHGVRLIGTPLEAIEMAEDRELFRDLLDRIGQPYAPSSIVEGDDRGRPRGLGRRRPGRDRPAGDRPAGVHPRRDRRRDRRDRAGLPRAGPGRPAGEPDRPGDGRALPRRLAGDRVRGHARRGRHVHRRLLDGERRPARRPHRRLDRGRARSRRCPTRSTSGCAARPWRSSGPSASRAAATSSSPSARTTRTTRSSRSTRGSAARRRWPARRPATRSPGSPPRSPSADGWPRSRTS